MTIIKWGKFWGDTLDIEDLDKDAIIEDLMIKGYSEFQAKALAEKIYNNRH